MDAAGPAFEFNSGEHRINASDAKCVELIHSSAGPPLLGGLGMMKPVGDIDIFINGGMYHQHCEISLFGTLIRGNGLYNKCVSPSFVSKDVIMMMLHI